MCGIAGIFAFQPSAPDAGREELRVVRDHMAARGPDGHGEWFSESGRVALGHRRLAIIDLSERGAQPMSSADGRLVITFNGEIYNYRELRKDLESAGRIFRTGSDTEVLLQLYEEYGEIMLGRLRGMFAFAIWDQRKQAMLLARDAFGIKPLYYSDGGGTLRFASQVKALLAGGHVDTTPQPAGHVGFFLWGSVPAPWTLYRGIQALPAGHLLWADSRGLAQPKPFCLISDILADAAAQPARGSVGDALDAIGAAVRDSIAAHHVSDVPVAVFLSAGIDSSLIAALSAAHGERLRTITLAFSEYTGTRDDEAPAAQALATQLGTRHSTVTVQKADFERQRAQLMAAMDQPSIDGINAWFISQAAQSLGVKVALSGLGGDELFASYPSFRQLPLLRDLARPFAGVPAAGRALRRLAGPVVSRFSSPKYASLLEYGTTLSDAYLLRRGLHMPWQLPTLLDPAMARQGWEDLQCRSKLAATTARIASDRLSVSALEMSWYTRHQLLVDTDWASMAHSLEVRVPFLDVPLLRAAAPWLAAHPKLTKQEIARALAPALPDSLLHKPKTGFSVPVREWLAGAVPGPTPRGLRGWAQHVYHGTLPPAAWADVPSQAAALLPATPASGIGQSIALWSPGMATPGGVQSYMWRLWEVLAATGSPSAPVPKGISLMDAPAQIAAWQSSVAMRPVGTAGRKLRFVRYAFSRPGRADCVIVGHVNQAGVAWVARKLSLIGHYVVVLHGIEAWRRLSLLQRLALRDASAVVATTRFSAQVCARENGLAGHNFQIVPLCADPVPAPADAHFALDGDFRILFVGRLARTERYKGLDSLMLAVAGLVDERGIAAKLHVIGDGDDRGRLENMAKHLGLGPGTVQFHGHVSEAQLQSAYASAHVFSMPSAKEGFGIVFLEAMRRGVACIGGAHGGTPEVFEDGAEGMLVPYGDTGELMARLEALATDAPLRQRLATAGKARFENSYTFPIFLNRWAQLLGRHAQS